MLKIPLLLGYRNAGRVRTAALVGLVLLPSSWDLFLSGQGRTDPLRLGWAGVVAQSSPNTCGPAVLATLLGMSGTPVSEAAIALQADLRPRGVTLAEFSRLSEEFGMPGKWFAMGRTRRLAELPVPSVIHSNESRGHFAIFLGSSGGFVNLADPARGRLILRTSTFRRSWTGRLFVFDSSPGSE